MHRDHFVDLVMCGDQSRASRELAIRYVQYRVWYAVFAHRYLYTVDLCICCVFLASLHMLQDRQPLMFAPFSEQSENVPPPPPCPGYYRIQTVCVC